MPHRTGDEEPTVTRLPSIGRTLSPQPPSSNPASPSKHPTSTTLVPISPSQKDLRSPKQQNIMHSDGTTALRVRTISSQEALATMRQAHTQKMIARSRANYAKQRQKFKLVQSIYLPHDDVASPVQLKFGPFIPPKLPAYERIPYKVYKNGLISPIQSPTHGDSHEKGTEHDQALDQSLPTSSFLVNQRRPYIPPRTLDPRHARSLEQHARHHHHAEEYHRQHGRTSGTSYQFKFLIPSRDMALSSGQRRGMAPITSGPDYFPVSPYLTDDSKRKHDHVLGYHDRKPRSPPQHHQHHHDYIQDQQQQFIDNINNQQQHDELMPDGRSERAVVNEVQPQEWGDDDVDAGDEEEEDAAKTETDTAVPTTTATTTSTTTTTTVPASVSVPASPAPAPAPARTALVSTSKRPYKQQVNISTQTDGDITTGSLITPRDSGEHTTSDADAQTEPIPVNEHADTRGTGTDGGEPTEGDTIVVPTQDAPPPPPQPEATDTQYTPDFEAVTASKLVEQTAAESQQQQELLNPRDQHGRTMRRKVANKKNQDVQKVAVSVSCRGLVLSHLGRNSHPLAAVYALDEEGFFHYVAETEVLLDTPDPNFRTHLIVDGCSPNQQFMFCIYDVEEDMTNATITDNHMVGYIIVRASDLQIAVDEKSLQLNLLYDPAYNSHLEDAAEGEPGIESSQQRIQQPGPIDGAYIILHNVTSAAQKRQKAYGEITPIDIAVVCKGLPKETNALTALYVKTDNTGLFEAAAHTERIKRSENPLFKELLPIDHFANYDRELMCVVYDIDGESKDETKSKDTIRPIGSCTFTLNYLLKKTKQEAAFQLMNEHKEYIPSTYIYLKAFLPALSTHVDTRATVIDGYQDMGKTYELNVALSQLPHNQHGIHIALYAKEKGKMAKKHEYIGETEKIRDTLNPTFNATLLIENVKPDDTLQYIFNVYDTQYQTHKVEDYATNKGLISNPMPAIDQAAVSVPLTEQQIAERARETRGDDDVGVVGIAPPAEEMVPTNIWMGRVTLTMKQLLQYTEDPDDPSQRVEAEFVLLDMANKPVGNSTIVIGLREREAM